MKKTMKWIAALAVALGAALTGAAQTAAFETDAEGYVVVRSSADLARALQDAASLRRADGRVRVRFAPTAAGAASARRLSAARRTAAAQAATDDDAIDFEIAEAKWLDEGETYLFDGAGFAFNLTVVDAGVDVTLTNLAVRTLAFGGTDAVVRLAADVTADAATGTGTVYLDDGAVVASHTAGVTLRAAEGCRLESVDGTAAVEGVRIVCTVTWIVDGAETTASVAWGETPAFAGGTPVKDGYDFTGWTPAVAPVTTDATYRAVFRLQGTAPGVTVTETTDEDGKTVTTLADENGTETVITDGTVTKNDDGTYTVTGPAVITLDGGDEIEVKDGETVTVDPKTGTVTWPAADNGDGTKTTTETDKDGTVTQETEKVDDTTDPPTTNIVSVVTGGTNTTDGVTVEPRPTARATGKHPASSKRTTTGRTP